MKRSTASQFSSLLVLSLLSSTASAGSISRSNDAVPLKVLPSAFAENYREVRLGATPVLEATPEALERSAASFVERIDDFPSDEIESKDGEHEEEYTTTTIYLKVTATVTRHPVCMTTYQEQPPCLPDSHPSFRRYSLSVNKDGTSNVVTEPVDDDQVADILRTHEINAVENELPNAEEGSVELESSAENTESRHIENPFARHPPFMSSMPSFPSLPSLPALPSLPQLPAFSELPVVSAFYPHSSSVPVQTVTTTIHATSTSHVVNPHVTAILIAHNCMPENIDIPYCPRPTTHHVYKQHAQHTEDQLEHHENNHTVTPSSVGAHSPLVPLPSAVTPLQSPPHHHHQPSLLPFFPSLYQSPYFSPYFPHNLYPFTYLYHHPAPQHHSAPQRPPKPVFST